MTSRINAKATPRPTPASGFPPSPTGTPTQAPSVPISLYRQVATELQATQTAMESLKTENKRLTEQNQHLRLEIERVVQSALQLRQLADAPGATSGPLLRDFPPSPAAPAPDLELHFESASVPTPPKPAKPSRKQSPKLDPDREPAAEKLFTEQESQPRRVASPERSTEIGGWWLVLVIFLIVVTAFGTGFLIVRPLLPNR